MLNKVTITGADDETPIVALIELSAKFPFVEWGILVSLKSEGGPRFPSRVWMDAFSTAAAEKVLSRVDARLWGMGTAALAGHAEVA